MQKSYIQISSRENQKLKNARKARDGREKDLIFIEGIRVCEEAVRANIKICECFIEKTFTNSERGRQIVEKLSDQKIEIYELTENIFSSITDTKTSQGIILIGEKPSASREQVELALKKRQSVNNLVLFLDEINNPSNLGAILRTAEAVGVSGVITSEKSADVFSQKSIRAAMGANFRLPIWTNADFYEVVEWAEKNHLKITVADIRSAEKYTEINWKTPRLLIFGSEAHGLPVEKLNYIADKIYIPMENEVESLNLAVSCGVILFEWKRANF